MMFPRRLWSQMKIQTIPSIITWFKLLGFLANAVDEFREIETIYEIYYREPVKGNEYSILFIIDVDKVGASPYSKKPKRENLTTVITFDKYWWK